MKIPVAKSTTPESFPVAAGTGPEALNCPVVTSIAPVTTRVKVPCWFVNVTVATNEAMLPETPVTERFPAMVPCNNPPPMTLPVVVPL